MTKYPSSNRTQLSMSCCGELFLSFQIHNNSIKFLNLRCQVCINVFKLHFLVICKINTCMYFTQIVVYVVNLWLLGIVSARGFLFQKKAFIRTYNQGVLGKISIAATKCDQKQVKDERVYLANTFTLLFLTGVSHDRNSNRAGS